MIFMKKIFLNLYLKPPKINKTKNKKLFKFNPHKTFISQKNKFLKKIKKNHKIVRRGDGASRVVR
jgi:hypothetical protein